MRRSGRCIAKRLADLMQTRAIEENKLDYWRPIFAKRLKSFEQSQPLRDDPTVKKAS